MADDRDNLQALFGSDSDTNSDDVSRRRAASPRQKTPISAASSPEGRGSRPGTPGGPRDSPIPNAGTSPAEKQYHILADEEDEDAEEEHVASPNFKQENGEAERDTEDQQDHPPEEPVNEAEAEDDEETRIEVDIARLDPDLTGRYVYWKLQDFLKSESKPFDAEAYDDEYEDYEDDPPPEIQDAIRQKIKGTMRWRYSTSADGTRGPPESNAKLVTWSDGSTSIAVGSEYYDASFIQLKGEHHQLFIRQGSGLQGGTVFKEKVILRPAIANPLARKSRLAARPAVGATAPIKEEQTRRSVFLHEISNKDPEKMRAELMRKEEERLKVSMRRETQQRRVRERVYNRGITTGFLEGNDEEDDNSISLSAIKNQFKRGDFTHRVYSDEDESDNESRRKKLEMAKDLDDDDDDFGVKKKKTEEGPAKKRVAVIEDDDDED